LRSRATRRSPDDPLRALRLVGPEAVKVVILGQDSYPTAGHADGLAFSAGKGRPRSLARIFELFAEAWPGFLRQQRGRSKAGRGKAVLLLNPVLTVEIGRSGSHLNCGWQALTRQIISYL
jgi:uracil-DNA glycosylase